MHRAPIATLLGVCWAQVDDDGSLTELLLPKPTTWSPVTGSDAARSTFDVLKRQLDEYFARKRRAFDVPMRLIGTDFELRVWQALLAIPYGATTSYGAIAQQLGLHNGARAVGRANGDNPIPIIVPCHRVIGTNGQLVGYGGGLPLKRALLELEGATPVAQLALL